MQWVVMLFWWEGGWRTVPDAAPVEIAAGGFDAFVAEVKALGEKYGTPVPCERVLLLCLDAEGDPVSICTLHLTRSDKVS